MLKLLKFVIKIRILLIKDEEIKTVIEVFKKNSSYNFSEYSAKSFRRRIEKILIDESCTIKKLITKLETNEKYLDYIKNKITVNTTELFRDSEMWISLYKPLKQYLIHKQDINIWHAGISSGEEIYSMKIFLDIINYKGNQKLLGTDFNNIILEIAKKGEYKNNIIADYINNYNLVRNGLSKYEFFNDFSKYITYNEDKDLLIIKNEYKNNIKIDFFDLINSEYNFNTKFDIIMCRNVLIYFDLNLQNTIINKFYNLLNKGGLLILGAHESIMPPLLNKFENKGDNIYQKITI